jgi:hypothetical protein
MHGSNYTDRNYANLHERLGLIMYMGAVVEICTGRFFWPGLARAQLGRPGQFITFELLARPVYFVL